MGQYQRTLPPSPTPKRVAGMLIPVPGGDIDNMFMSLAEVRSFQTWGLGKLTVQ